MHKIPFHCIYRELSIPYHLVEVIFLIIIGNISRTYSKNGPKPIHQYISSLLSHVEAECHGILRWPPDRFLLQVLNWAIFEGAIVVKYAELKCIGGDLSVNSIFI